MPADLAALTAEQIIGADIHDANGEVIASVDDLVLGPDGKAESVAAKFGGFLGFGSNTVLLTLDEVEFMQNDSGQIALRTAVTPSPSRAVRTTRRADALLTGRTGPPCPRTAVLFVPAARLYGRPPEAPDVQIIPTNSIPVPYRFHTRFFPRFPTFA